MGALTVRLWRTRRHCLLLTLSFQLAGCAFAGIQYAPHQEPVTAQAAARWEGSDRVDVLRMDSSAVRLKLARVHHDTLWGQQVAPAPDSANAPRPAIPLADIRAWTWWWPQTNPLREELVLEGGALLILVTLAALTH